MSPAESEKISAAYKTEKKKLLDYISRRVPVHTEAEDILQDVFYQLTVGFRDLDRIQNLTAWLYKVTDNRITDLFRKKRPVSISYSETAGLFLLSKILLTGVAPQGGHDKSHKKEWRRKYQGRYGYCEDTKEETAAPEV